MSARRGRGIGDRRGCLQRDVSRSIIRRVGTKFLVYFWVLVYVGCVSFYFCVYLLRRGGRLGFTRGLLGACVRTGRGAGIAQGSRGDT